MCMLQPGVKYDIFIAFIGMQPYNGKEFVGFVNFEVNRADGTRYSHECLLSQKLLRAAWTDVFQRTFQATRRVSYPDWYTSATTDLFLSVSVH